MVRFIFFCMAIVGLSLTAIPAMNIYNGISSERNAVMAEAETLQSVEEQMAADKSAAAALNDIETAAGGFEDAIEDNSELSSGFRNTAPAAF